jgi:hypothetical protein
MGARRVSLPSSLRFLIVLCVIGNAARLLLLTAYQHIAGRLFGIGSNGRKPNDSNCVPLRYVAAYRHFGRSLAGYRNGSNRALFGNAERLLKKDSFPC